MSEESFLRYTDLAATLFQFVDQTITVAFLSKPLAVHLAFLGEHLLLKSLQKIIGRMIQHLWSVLRRGFLAIFME
jgi:hypothetical protein